MVTNELEDGDRQKAMKRLRVPPLGAAQVSTHFQGFVSFCIFNNTILLLPGIITLKDFVSSCYYSHLKKEN